MSKTAQKKYKRNFFLYLGLVAILILSMLQLREFFGSKDVLGASASEIEEVNSSTDSFWKEFLQENPDYIPGWEDIGDTQKIKQIDPNYFLQP